MKKNIKKIIILSTLIMLVSFVGVKVINKLRTDKIKNEILKKKTEKENAVFINEVTRTDLNDGFFSYFTNKPNKDFNSSLELLVMCRKENMNHPSEITYTLMFNLHNVPEVYFENKGIYITFPDGGSYKETFDSSNIKYNRESKTLISSISSGFQPLYFSRGIQSLHIDFIDIPINPIDIKRINVQINYIKDELMKDKLKDIQ